MKNYIVGLIVFIALADCSAQVNNEPDFLRSYYFPYHKFGSPYVYHYMDMNDTSRKETWIMQTKIQGGDTLFLTQRLDSKNRIHESLVERITPACAKMQQLKMWQHYDSPNPAYLPDTVIARECEIVDSVIFKWNQKRKESVLWKVNYESFHSPETVILSKSRMLWKIDAKNGIAVFKDKYYRGLVSSENFSSNWIGEWSYKKGKGLIRYKTGDSDYRLVGITNLYE